MDRAGSHALSFERLDPENLGELRFGRCSCIYSVVNEAFKLQIRQAKLTFVLIASFLFGGGGAPYPFQNMLVQVVCIAIACWPPATTSPRIDFRRIDKVLLALVALTILLPAFQTIKLPPALWQALPGRDLVSQALATIAMPNAWMSYSVDPARTLLAALSLIPAFVSAVLVAGTPVAQRSHGLKVLVCLGLVVVIIGAVQLASGNRLLVPFNQIRNPNQLHGLFAYHNATGLFLVICLIVVIGLPAQIRNARLELAARGLLGLVFSVAIILTQSRSALALSGLPLALLVWRFLLTLRAGQLNLSTRVTAAVCLVCTIVAVGGGAMLMSNHKVQQTLTRFDDLQDVRPAIWQDSLTALAAYWPAGSGMGTFTTVFPIYESLENLTPAVINRAHNDYIELGIEAGITGYILLLAWVVFVLVGSLRRGDDLGVRAQQVIAVTAFVAIAGQAVIDYPLRNEAMLAVAGVLAGLMARPVNNEGKRS